QRDYSVARELYATGKFDAAADLLAQARRSGPMAAKSRLLWCRALVKSRRFEEAAQLLPELLQERGRDAEWRRAVGRLAISLQAWAAAIETWLPLATPDSDSTEPFRQLARAYSGLGQDFLALELAERALEREPGNDEMLRILIRALLAIGMLGPSQE